MLEQSRTVSFQENPQQALNRLYAEWRRLREHGRYFEADQVKHQISMQKRLLKSLPKK